MQKIKLTLSDEDEGIIRRALARHRNALIAARDKCAGNLYPVIYNREAEATAAALQNYYGGHRYCGQCPPCKTITQPERKN